MAQLFPKSANALIRVALAAIVVGIGCFFLTLYLIDTSSYNTRKGLPVEQPLQFSHDHHVGGMGIGCRYCHQSFERSAFAGVPGASVCMGCHAKVWSNAPILALVRESYDKGTPLRWRRVTDLPDFTYFNHAVHVAKGIGCESCHGRVDQMPLMWKAADMKMQWCLNCHRNPVPHVRPPAAVTEMGWSPPEGEDPVRYRAQLAKELNVHPRTDCYTCHR